MPDQTEHLTDCFVWWRGHRNRNIWHRVRQSELWLVSDVGPQSWTMCHLRLDRGPLVLHDWIHLTLRCKNCEQAWERDIARTRSDDRRAAAGALEEYWSQYDSEEVRRALGPIMPAVRSAIERPG